jgi:predicted O-methyltransferase YrrM
MSLLDRSPVFVVGAQRSGTTWVQRLLADHPAIVSGQESHLFARYLAPLWQRWQLEQQLRDRGGRTIGLGCYLTEEELLEECRGLARRVFARLEQAKPAATILVEKTPDHGLHLPLIRLLFPDATILHVLRDGRDVVASLLDAQRRPWGRDWAPSSARDAACRWAEWVSAIRAGLPGFRRARTLRYEELVAAGPSALAELYDFLGVPLPLPEVEAIHDRWRFDASSEAVRSDSLKVVGACRQAAPAEPEGFFRRGRPGPWQRDLSPAEQKAVQAVAGDLLSELGYLPAPDSAAPVEQPPTEGFVSTAPKNDVLWARPSSLEVLDSTNAQMLARERLYLYATVLALAPERCLEIGVAQGGSTRILHAALADLGRGQLLALDPQPALTFPAERLADRVTFLTGASPACLPRACHLAGGPFDFVLVDGDHSARGVLADLEGLIEVTHPATLVLLHDAYCPSVSAGIDAALASGLPYVDGGIVSTTCHPGRLGRRAINYAGFRLLVRGNGPAPGRFDRLARRVAWAVRRRIGLAP